MEESLAKRRVETYRLGRKRRGDIRVFVLWALNDHPMHGYELMHYLSEKTYGSWKPSAGSIYPTLQILEDQGFAKATTKDDKKVYTITEAGRTKLHYLEVGSFENDPEQLTAIQELREANSTIGQLMKVIISRGSVSNLQQTAHIMNETRAQLVAIYDSLAI